MIMEKITNANRVTSNAELVTAVAITVSYAKEIEAEIHVCVQSRPMMILPP